MSRPSGVSLRDALGDLGRAKATGQLLLGDSSGHQARIHFDEGVIVAIQMPDHRPRIGMRLVAAGVVSPDQLAAALQQQRAAAQPEAGSDIGSARIGDVLVRIGAVTRQVVDQVARAQMADNLAGLLVWDVVSTRFEPADSRAPRVANDVRIEASDLLADADARRPTLLELLRRLGGPSVVPDLAGVPTVDPHPSLGPHDWALLCKIDGQRPLSELAAACGFTMLEAAQILDGLLSVGLVTVSRPPSGGDRLEEVDTAALLRELSNLGSGAVAASRRPVGVVGRPAQRSA